MDDYYALLEISPTASDDTIRTALRDHQRKWSKRANVAPNLKDRQEAEQRVERLGEARQVLLDTNAKARYDQLRTGPPAPQFPPQNQFSPPQQPQFQPEFRSPQPPPQERISPDYPPPQPSPLPQRRSEAEVHPAGLRQIRNSRDLVKIRSPWAVALLTLITLGIYTIVWWYRVNRELHDYGRVRGYDLGQNPTNSLLALFPGGFLIVPALITYWRGTKRVQAAGRLANTQQPVGWIALILFVAGIFTYGVLALAFFAYLQVSLNDLWRSEADPVAPPPR